MASSTASTGVSFGSLLFIVFLVLRLTHVIDWSWWWVTAPLWGPLAIVLVILILGLLVTVLTSTVAAMIEN